MKTIVFSILIVLIFLGIMEIASKFFYSHHVIPKRRNAITNTGGAPVIACFGGSTTAGYNRDASSWPEELSRLTGAEVRNYGADGTDSDYAVGMLSIANHDGKVNYILWCNFVNETDRLHNKSFLLHRIGATLQRWSALYSVMYELATKIRIDTGMAKKQPNMNIPVKKAWTAYRNNTDTAINYATKHGIQFVIVRLPYPAGAKYPDLIGKVMYQISADSNVPLIDVQKCYLEKGLSIDQVHQLKDGHIETAKCINNYFRGGK